MSVCTLYTNRSLKNGYGRAWIKGERRVGLAHRMAFSNKYGRIPDGLTIHHTCHNPLCLNVDHMVLLSRSQHSLLTLKEMIPKEFCKRGHRIEGRNSKQRFCLVCKRESANRYARKIRMDIEKMEKINARRRELKKLRKEIK